MPDTVDDFMKRFSGGGSVDDEQAAQFHDRFVSTKPEDSQFENRAYHEGATEYLGKLPDEQFHEAARNAVAQAPPQERQGLLGSLMGALSGGAAGGAGMGGGLAGIASMLGLGTTDPKQMSDDDAARVMNYARKEQPEALRQTVAEKPWFVKAMGNPVVMGALTVAAAKLLSNQRKRF
ncbi:MAG: hypothetical protein H0X34_01060 [Chthoniobacterales bacterium]|nr:hypothetical protein [Chthoniobacterales bacterium]